MSQLTNSFYSLTHALSLFFFFNDTATTEIYTLSLHDALPISGIFGPNGSGKTTLLEAIAWAIYGAQAVRGDRSEEHTSELQSLAYLVCRLLLEKKKHNIQPSFRLRPCPGAHQPLRTAYRRSQR